MEDPPCQEERRLLHLLLQSSLLDRIRKRSLKVHKMVPITRIQQTAPRFPHRDEADQDQKLLLETQEMPDKIAIELETHQHLRGDPHEEDECARCRGS